MHILVVGLNHRTADVELRERLAIRKTHLPQAIRSLCSYSAIRSALILSTCNRMELYIQTDDIDEARNQSIEFLESYHSISRMRFTSALYTKADADVTHHLFSVVCSLDSMVLGEQQIIGQIRYAFKTALNEGSLTLVMSHLFRQALEVGKRVRSQTSISESHVSVSTVAVDVAKRAFPDLSVARVLIVGSGEMSELAARYLCEQGVQSVVVSSRTYDHACHLADELHGQACRFEDLKTLIPQADIILSSTAAPHFVLTPSLFKSVDHPMLILDIALPRDVDPACAHNDRITLFDLDDLADEVQRNQDKRRSAAQQARAIVDEECDLFSSWVDEHSITPTIKEMRMKAEQVRRLEVDHLVKNLDIDLSDQDRHAIDKATNAIVNKLLHTPTVRMKKSVDSDSDFECVEAARFLFGLSDGSVEHSHVLANETLSISQ